MKNILKALSEFRNECPPLVFNKKVKNKGFEYEYTDLIELINTVNPVLFKKGLVFSQLTNENILTTIIHHIESGESIESTISCPYSEDVKAYGAKETYLKRRQLMLILGVQGESENENNLPKSPEEKEEDTRPFASDKLLLTAVKMIAEGKKTYEEVTKSPNVRFTDEQLKKLNEAIKLI